VVDGSAAIGLGALATGAALAQIDSLAFTIYKALPGATMFRWPRRLLDVTTP
jgi:hypothetical protein